MSEELNLSAEALKYGSGTVLGFLLYKALEIIQILVKKRKAEDADDQTQPERRIGNKEILEAANAAKASADLARDSAADAVTATAEVANIAERIEEKVVRSMEIQHELASAFKDLANTMDKLVSLNQDAKTLFQSMSEKITIASAKIEAFLSTKGN